MKILILLILKETDHQPLPRCRWRETCRNTSLLLWHNLHIHLLLLLHIFAFLTALLHLPPSTCCRWVCLALLFTIPHLSDPSPATGSKDDWLDLLVLSLRWDKGSLIFLFPLFFSLIFFVPSSSSSYSFSNHAIGLYLLFSTMSLPSSSHCSTLHLFLVLT